MTYTICMWDDLYLKFQCRLIHSVHGPKCTISCCDWDLCNRECGAGIFSDTVLENDL